MKQISIFFLLLLLTLSCSISKRGEYTLIKNESSYKINYSKTIYPNKTQLLHKSDINIALLSKINSFNPFLSRNSTEQLLKKALFVTLFYREPLNGNPVKNIITDYRVSDNNLLYTFTIKKNILFSDGSSLTSHDIVASLKLLFTVLKDSNYYKGFFLLNKEMLPQYIDDYSFTITLDEPNSNLLLALCDFPILSEKNIISIDTHIEKFLKLWRENYTDLLFSGPFVIDKVDNKNIILKRNKKYFKKDKNKNYLPYSNRIILTTFTKEMKNTDIIEFDDYYTKQNFDNNIKNNKIIYTGNSANKIFFAYNIYSKNSKMYVKDLRIRKKIFLTIDKALQNNKINYSDSLFNKKREKDIFDNIKLDDINLDSRKEDLEGNTISLNILTLEDGITTELGKTIKKEFDNEQIESFIVKCDYSQFIEKVFYDKEFDIALINYNFNNILPNIFELFNSNDIGFYPFFTDNKKTENLIDLVNVLVKNNKIKKTLDKIDTYLINNLQFIPIVYGKKYFSVSNKIHNLKLNFNIENGFNIKTLEYLFKE